MKSMVKITCKYIAYNGYCKISDVADGKDDLGYDDYGNCICQDYDNPTEMCIMYESTGIETITTEEV